MSATIQTRFWAAIVAIAPAVLLAGLVYHPYIPFVPDPAAVAAEAAADTTRWGIAHLVVGVGSGFAVLAFFAVQSHLRAAGAERLSDLAFPLIVMGSTLFTLLPGMEFAVLAAARTGADVQAAQTALVPWFVPTLLTGAVSFVLGVLGFARGIAHSGILSPRLTRLIVAALVLMAAARFVPLGIVQFYVGGAAGIVALWPLAYAMWTHTAARSAEQPRLLPMA